ncbi:phage holin [Enterococcus sp. LJL128]
MNKVSSETIARTIVLFLALINQLLAILGKGTLDIAENDVYQVVSLLFTIVSTLIAWWKNNSFTAAAIEADKRMKEGNKDE